MEKLENWKLIIPLAVAIVSAISAFIFTQLQKWYDFRNRRRSVAIAILVEITEADVSISSLHINWENLKVKLKNPDYKPMLILSSDTKILERIKIEEYDFPNSVISSTTKFRNLINEVYECINAINQDKFNLIDLASKVRIVDMILIISKQVNEQAIIVKESMRTTLPKRWFKNINF
ncbi:MAG: hypothetical protein QM687_08265 [Ferruginibacter sp.]